MKFSDEEKKRVSAAIVLALEEMGGEGKVVDIAHRIGFENGQPIANLMKKMEGQGLIHVSRSRVGSGTVTWKLGKSPSLVAREEEKNTTSRGRVYLLTDTRNNEPTGAVYADHGQTATCMW